MKLNLAWRWRTFGVLATVALVAAGRAGAAACTDADMEALRWLDRMSRSIHQVRFNFTVKPYSCMYGTRAKGTSPLGELRAACSACSCRYFAIRWRASS